MVENLLETGTPFDYKDFDFKHLKNVVKKYRKDHSDSQINDLLNLDLPIQTDQDNNPDKNQNYIDKDKSFEDE